MPGAASRTVSRKGRGPVSRTEGPVSQTDDGVTAVLKEADSTAADSTAPAKQVQFSEQAAGASGLRWATTGTTKPAAGRELSHEPLATALASKSEFTPEAWGALGISDLRWDDFIRVGDCLLYTSPSPRDGLLSRMPSSA